MSTLSLRLRPFWQILKSLRDRISMHLRSQENQMSLVVYGHRCCHRQRYLKISKVFYKIELGQLKESFMRQILILSIALLPIFSEAQEREIPEDCEVLEGWVTVWIDQVRQAREKIINLKMEGLAPESDLESKYEYVQYESERFSKAFETRCNSQGFQAQN